MRSWILLCAAIVAANAGFATIAPARNNSSQNPPPSQDRSGGHPAAQPHRTTPTYRAPNSSQSYAPQYHHSYSPGTVLPPSSGYRPPSAVGAVPPPTSGRPNFAAVPPTEPAEGAGNTGRPAYQQPQYRKGHAAVAPVEPGEGVGNSGRPTYQQPPIYPRYRKGHVASTDAPNSAVSSQHASLTPSVSVLLSSPVDQQFVRQLNGVQMQILNAYTPQQIQQLQQSGQWEQTKNTIVGLAALSQPNSAANSSYSAPPTVSSPVTATNPVQPPIQNSSPSGVGLPGVNGQGNFVTPSGAVVSYATGKIVTPPPAPTSPPSPTTVANASSQPQTNASAYTFQTDSYGNVVVFQSGQRISTGTAQNAATYYGYKTPAAQSPAPTLAPNPGATTATGTYSQGNGGASQKYTVAAGNAQSSTLTGASGPTTSVSPQTLKTVLSPSLSATLSSPADQQFIGQLNNVQMQILNAYTPQQIQQQQQSGQWTTTKNTISGLAALSPAEISANPVAQTHSIYTVQLEKGSAAASPASELAPTPSKLLSAVPLQTTVAQSTPQFIANAGPKSSNNSFGQIISTVNFTNGAIALRTVPNPNGKLGSPAHQEMVDDAAQFLEERGLTVIREYRFEIPDGLYKTVRYADVVGVDAEGEIKYVIQVGKTLSNGQPVSREMKAFSDFLQNPQVKDAEFEFWEYLAEVPK